MINNVLHVCIMLRINQLNLFQKCVLNVLVILNLILFLIIRSVLVVLRIGNWRILLLDSNVVVVGLLMGCLPVDVFLLLSVHSLSMVPMSQVELSIRHHGQVLGDYSKN